MKKKLTEAYVKTENGVDVEVLCKLCGIPIRNLKNFNGVGVLVENANYYEITLEMEDGTAHETAICRGCAKGLTEADRDLLYSIDIKQWEKENFDKRFIEKMKARKVTAHNNVTRHQGA